MRITDLKSSRTIEKYQSQIASPYLEDFVSWLESQGYARMCIKRKIEGAVNFVSWAKRKKLAINRLDQLTLAKFRRHLVRRKSLRYPSGRYNRVYLNARIFVSFLESRGVVGVGSAQCSQDQIHLALQEFNDWMRTHRGTLDSTLANYWLPVTKLLKSLGTDTRKLNAKSLREFFLHQVEHSTAGTWRNLTTALRMFIRFLISKGDCPAGLDYAIPSAARWSLASLPKYLPAAEIDKLINSCNQNQAMGARNKAVLLLIARLGLRASEVRALTIEDINWVEGTLTVSGKNRRQTRLPLPQEVGDAILYYLVHARPTAASDHIFVTIVAPYRPITRQAINYIVMRSMRVTGITAVSGGSHLLRHSAATTMLREGISLPTIGAVLRHASLETTAIYAKVDFALLAEIALPWPEVHSC